MGATIQDIFGQADTAEPATPGTYGEAPSGFRLPEQVRLGPVRLQVSDLERSLAFYQDVLGLRPLERDTAEATLGPQESDSPLVHLRAEEARERYRSAERSASITLPFCCRTGRHWADSFVIWARSTPGPAPATIWSANLCISRIPTTWASKSTPTVPAAPGAGLGGS